MKIGIVSDIHSEFWDKSDLENVGGKIKKQVKDADIILLAGDIGNGTQAIGFANYLFSEKIVCMVAGNHEFYAGVYPDVVNDMRKASKELSINYLNRDVYINNDWGIRVIGATLWTDYNLYNTPEISMMHCSKYMSDFDLIKKSIYEKLTPQHCLEFHIQDKDWLQKEMDKPYDGKTIIMTHHAPVTISEHPKFVNDRNSPAFISNLDNMFTRDDIDLVVWGHTHYSVDKIFGKTRFISNQVGYLGGLYGNGNVTETDDFGITIEL